jgi:hypothetical protein
VAAVTVDRERRIVIGNRRLVTGQVDIASDGDTYDTKLNKIEYFSGVGSGGNVIDGAVSSGTITWNTSGAETDVLVEVIGF